MDTYGNRTLRQSFDTRSADFTSSIKGDARVCHKRKWTIKEEIQEIGSGAKTRPKREALLKQARRRQVDAIIVWRLDRWGRSVSDLIGTIRELTDIGVGFVSLTEALDLTTPAGKVMAGMLAVLPNLSVVFCAKE